MKSVGNQYIFEQETLSLWAELDKVSKMAVSCTTLNLYQCPFDSSRAREVWLNEAVALVAAAGSYLTLHHRFGSAAFIFMKFSTRCNFMGYVIGWEVNPGSIAQDDCTYNCVFLHVCIYILIHTYI